MSVSAPPVARGMQGQRAGIVSRFLADAIDLLVIVVAVVGVYFAVSVARFLLHPRQVQLARGLRPVPQHARLDPPHRLPDDRVGRAPGARGARACSGCAWSPHKDVGLPLWRAFVRAILCALFPIGLFWSAISSRNESVQDLLVRTTVVYDWGPKLPRLQ